MFSDFHQKLQDFVKTFEQENLQLKMESDLDNDIIKIFGEKISSLARAKNGLGDLGELAYSTAEHHPYWNLLYQCVQIATTVLDKWESKLTAEELSEINWSIDEIKNTCNMLKDADHS